jgi:hypothetical protein
MKYLVNAIFLILALAVGTDSYGQSRIMRQINEYKATIAQIGGTAKIKPICGKGKNATHTLDVELSFNDTTSYSFFQELEEPAANEEVNNLSHKQKQDMVVNVAVSAWWDILEMDSSFKKINVKIVIVGIVMLSQCFITVDEDHLGFCGELKETDLTGCGGLCITNF